MDGSNHQVRVTCGKVLLPLGSVRDHPDFASLVVALFSNVAILANYIMDPFERFSVCHRTD